MVAKKSEAELREMLLARRREILDFRRNVNSSWQSLNEPEKEMEEIASKASLSRGLEQLDDRCSDDIGRIDAALAKMEEREYGVCEGCRRPIALKRLQAVPWARHCVRCAAAREAFDRDGVEAPAVALDKPEMTDEAIQEAVLDALNEDGRVEMEELNIACEDGVVYLEGALPSEESREILLEIVEDVLDFNEKVDNITIDRQLWERPELTPRPNSGKTDKEVAMDGEDEEVDPYTSMSTGEPMTPPDKMTREKP
jgi:DnaK suppressor protein